LGVELGVKDVARNQGGLGLLTVALFVGLGAFVSNCTFWSARHVEVPPYSGTTIAVESLGGGSIKLKRARRKLIVHLAQEISGCTGRLYDSVTNEEYESTPSFEVVDETEKTPYIYLVLLATAPPNCNVQGRCGAGGPDSTLIWLKLTEGLTLAGKQAFAIDDCRADRYAAITREEGSGDHHAELRARDLLWVGDALKIDFEEGTEDLIRRLVYDRRNPDAGLQRIP
jgi:hypothetical protein